MIILWVMKAYPSHYQEQRSITKEQVTAASARDQPISQSQDRFSVCTVTELSAITRATITVRAASFPGLFSVTKILYCPYTLHTNLKCLKIGYFQKKSPAAGIFSSFSPVLPRNSLTKVVIAGRGTKMLSRGTA